MTSWRAAWRQAALQRSTARTGAEKLSSVIPYVLLARCALCQLDAVLSVLNVNARLSQSDM